MIILSIDTATDAVSVAIADGARVLAASEMTSERQHAEVLTPMIDFVRKQAGVAFGDVGAVAVDIGPGLFTGMRVGIASAKAIAQVLDVPIIGVTSLDILATALARTDDVIASVIDARRGEVYWSMYRYIDGKIRQVSNPETGTIETCTLQTIDRGQATVFVGNGALRYRHEIELAVAGVLPQHAFADELHAYPKASVLAQLAHERALRQDWQEADALVPQYLRLPDAEINWATRSAS
ncbi:MAG: tRNA (adenosine(37)-N6)-threonylcarbamoyltransferase complex dimerization subunit type 1 TsaB [Actinobacteria bacterium]|nr:MAG: tRNA (adenosine(37)-N6)-threonylcarbamoyltransferase complex dimerization subunit type 1 TsaB [Actinomycetota bacterium]